LLRYLFNEDTSHVGLLFNFDNINLACDVNNPTGSVYDSKFWLHKYTVIHQVELSLSHNKEIALYKECAEYCVLRKYDFNGYLYGLIWGLLHKFFKIKMPTYNKWSNHTGSMCHEVVVPVLKSQIVKDTGINSPVLDFSNVTPDKVADFMMELTKGNPQWVWRD